MPHTCHAYLCETPVKPELLMCLKHWRMVPRELQRGVWKHYRRGQCDDKKPSKAWLQASAKAIQFVAIEEYGSEGIGLAVVLTEGSEARSEN